MFDHIRAPGLRTRYQITNDGQYGSIIGTREEDRWKNSRSSKKPRRCTRPAGGSRKLKAASIASSAPAIAIFVQVKLAFASFGSIRTASFTIWVTALRRRCKSI